MNKLPERVLKALAAADIRINTNFNVEVTELKSTIPKAVIFASYAFGDYHSGVFYYKITIPNMWGMVIVEDTKTSVRVIRNTLTTEVSCDW